MAPWGQRMTRIRRGRGRRAQVTVDVKKIFRAAIKRLHISVGDGPGRRDAPLMLDDTKVFGAHAKHRRAVHLGLAAHEIRLLRVERLAVLILPGLLGVVAVVQEDSGCIPVELLLRHERAALQDENVLARLGEVQGQCSSTRPGAYDNRVKFAWCAHLEHGIRFTCLKIRIHCRRGP